MQFLPEFCRCSLWHCTVAEKREREGGENKIQNEGIIKCSRNGFCEAILRAVRRSQRASKSEFKQKAEKLNYDNMALQALLCRVFLYVFYQNNWISHHLYFVHRQSSFLWCMESKAICTDTFIWRREKTTLALFVFSTDSQCHWNAYLHIRQC